MKERSRARGWALHALYAWETRGSQDSPAAMLTELDQDRNISAASVPYARRLLDTFHRHRTTLDRSLEDFLSNWRLERLSVIDRNILRLAATEILYFDDVPPRVSIQEAIVLAEKYSTRESPRFVNGVLDALMRARDGAGTGEHP